MGVLLQSGRPVDATEETPVTARTRLKALIAIFIRKLRRTSQTCHDHRTALYSIPVIRSAGIILRRDSLLIFCRHQHQTALLKKPSRIQPVSCRVELRRALSASV